MCTGFEVAMLAAAAVVRQMREMVKSGRTMKQVGRAIGVSASSVCMIASGKRWGHVA